MRLGVLARASNRGLGIQTHAFYEHMRPERTLVLDMGKGRDPMEMHLSRYPDAWDVASPEQLSEAELTQFLSGLDVLWTAETFYSDNVVPMARQLGVRTVVHANYEFLLWISHPQMPRPDEFWAPSPWRIDDWPEPKRLMPFPVDRDRFPFKLRTSAETFLHTGGWPTQADRNGTWTFLHALQHIRTPMRVIVTAQSAPPTSLTDPRNLPKCVELDLRVGDVEDNRTLYEEADVLVLPRRFGGLSLPMNEAASLGLPILATDREPERCWLPPDALLPVRSVRHFDGQPGPIAIEDCAAEDLAARMMELTTEPALVEKLSMNSDLFASQISWDVQRPRIDVALDALVR